MYRDRHEPDSWLHWDANRRFSARKLLNEYLQGLRDDGYTIVGVHTDCVFASKNKILYKFTWRYE